ncbi:DMT family transporter [Sorangium sp. So ce260]|uniref:DMT family transporter n=1 Tax=Sorangium sp. So ce260 TaxID=3133291 RepID=UPI003F5FBFD3
MSQLSGVLLGVAVNFIWGLAFLVPYALPSVDPISITVGRYGTYGVLSAVLLLTRSRRVLSVMNARDWLWALGLAFAGNAGYYAVLVLSIRHAGVPVAALIVGSLPVTMAVYGNWIGRELDVRRLIPPLSLILGGLIAMNGYKLVNAPSPSASRDLVMGIVYAMSALGLWTWYGVQNAHYLKRRSQVQGADWSAAIGVGTLALTLGALPVLMIAGTWSPERALAELGASGKFPAFLAGSLLLGVVVSWLATVMWNIAARKLPVSLAAQLIVFETVSSVIYASILDGAPPAMFELLCISAILLGVLLGIRSTLRPPRTLPAATD